MTPAGFRPAREPGHGCLGVPVLSKNASASRLQGEDVTGPDQIVGALRRQEAPDRAGSSYRADCLSTRPCAHRRIALKAVRN